MRISIRNRKSNLSNLILLLSALTACLLFSCNGDNKANEKADTNKIFRLNLNSSLSSCDPAFAKDQSTIWVANQIFNGLVQLDDDLNVQPCIAKFWEISDDGLSYTFHLNSGVYFHENQSVGIESRQLTATDVQFSFERILDPKLASPGAWIFNGRVAESNPFEAIDDFTFRLNLSKPFPAMLGILSMQYCSIVSKEAANQLGDQFRSKPIGTGPFYLKNWIEGESLILLKNEHYFESTTDNPIPKIDGARISFIENKRTAYLEFTKGNLHFLSGLDASYKDDLLNKNGKLKDDLKQQCQLLRSPYLNTEYLGILVNRANLPEESNKSLIEYKQLRKALNYGFNRTEMLQYLRNGIGIPAVGGFIPAGLPGHQADIGYSYQPDSVSAILKRINYSAEKFGAIELITSASYEDLAVFMTKSWNELGIKSVIEISPPAFQRELMAKRQAAFFRGSWIADYPDAENYLALFYGKYGAPPNYTGFDNAEFNALYEQAMQTENASERTELYQQMDEIMMEESVVIPLYYDEVLRFAHKGISGLEPNPINLLHLKLVGMK